MENINQFNINRVFWLIYRQLVINSKPWMIGVIATAGFLLGVFILQMLVSEGNFNFGAYKGLGFVILFLGGYVFSSNIFNELQSPVKGHFYMMIPARIEEKLMASWLMSSVLYAIISLTLLSIISFLLSGVQILFLGGNILLFNPLSDVALKATGVYLVTQTIFLLGSVYFKKYNFLKTLLSIFVVYMIIFVWGMIMIFTIIKPQDIVFEGSVEFYHWQLFDSAQIAVFFKYIFWYFTGPFFLIVSYLRLKERQV